MTRIAISYYSDSGHAKKLAEHVSNGMTSVNATPILIDVAKMSEDDWTVLENVDGIVFGTPTHMGSAAAGFKQFMDKSSDIWFERKWSNKIAAGFTTAVSNGGDKLSTLMQLSVFAAQHGMIWVGQDQIGAPVVKANEGINAAGMWLGLGATDSLDRVEVITEGDAETARRFGVRVAEAARRWG